MVINKRLNFSEIQEDKFKISNFFLELCKKQGLEIHSPLPIKINFDPSLEFTTCTICIFKNFVIKNKPLKGYATVQPALRTNTHNLKEPLIWNAELTMLGGFIPVNTFTNSPFDFLINLQYSFLKKLTNNEFDIILTVPTFFLDDRIINEETIQRISEDISVINVDEYEDLYWKYGLDGIYGIGSRWEIMNKYTKEVYNFGNVIFIYDKYNNGIGVEFGGGLEVLIQALKNLPYKILTSSNYSEVLLNDIKNLDINCRLNDLLITSIYIMFEISFLRNINNIRLNHTLYQYILSLKEVMFQNNIKEESVIKLLEDIINKNKEWYYAKDILVPEFKDFYRRILHKKLDLNFNV